MNYRIRSILIAVVIAFSGIMANGGKGGGLTRSDSFTRISREPGGIGLGKGGYGGEGSRSLSGARVGYGGLGGAAKGDGKGNIDGTGKGGYGGYTSGTLPMAPSYLHPLAPKQFEESPALHQAGSLRRSSSRAAIRQISEAYAVSKKHQVPSM